MHDSSVNKSPVFLWIITLPLKDIITTWLRLNANIHNIYFVLRFLLIAFVFLFGISVLVPWHCVCLSASFPHSQFNVEQFPFVIFKKIYIFKIVFVAFLAGVEVILCSPRICFRIWVFFRCCFRFLNEFLSVRSYDAFFYNGFHFISIKSLSRLCIRNGVRRTETISASEMWSGEITRQPKEKKLFHHFCELYYADENMGKYIYMYISRW